MFEASVATPLGPPTSAIELLGHFSRAMLRCREADVALISQRLGIDLPSIACRSTRTADLSALWLGPDEWLVMSAGSMPSGDGWVATLADKLGNALHSLVDVSHRQVALSVHGPRAEEILSSDCALDLALDAFSVGMCTRTMHGKVEVVLWRTAADRFRLEIWRSFARHIEALLHEAENEA